MTVVVAIITLSFAVFLCWVVFKCVKRQKWAYLSVLVPSIAFLSVAWNPAIVGFIKAELIGILAAKTGALGTKLDDTIKVVGAVRDDVQKQQAELSAHQKTIVTQQGMLTKQQQDLKRLQELLNAQEGTLTTQQQVIDRSQKDLAAAYVTLDQQQKKLSNIDALTKNIFQQFRVETFKYPDNERLLVSHDVAKDHGAIVVVRLAAIPIAESVELQWHVTRQSPAAVQVFGNMLVLFWDDGAARAKDKQWAVKYVADPTATGKCLEFSYENQTCRFGPFQIHGKEMRIDGKVVSTPLDK